MTGTNYKMKGCPASIAFLADTHDTAPGPILSSLRSRSPALIVHTGDFLHGWKQRSDVNIEECHNALQLLRSCAELALTLVSIGNHESYLSGTEIEIIRSTGVTLLNNSYVTLEIKGRKTIIGGLSSGYYTAFQQGEISASESYSEIKRRHKTPAPEIGSSYPGTRTADNGDSTTCARNSGAASMRRTRACSRSSPAASWAVGRSSAED